MAKSKEKDFKITVKISDAPEKEKREALHHCLGILLFSTTKKELDKNENN